MRPERAWSSRSWGAITAGRSARAPSRRAIAIAAATATSRTARTLFRIHIVSGARTTRNERTAICIASNSSRRTSRPNTTPSGMRKRVSPSLRRSTSSRFKAPAGTSCRPPGIFRHSKRFSTSAASYVDRENEAIDRVATRFAESFVSNVGETIEPVPEPASEPETRRRRWR